MKETLGSGLVDLLDGQGDRRGAVAAGACESGLRLLNGGLEVGVESPVAAGLGGDDLYTFLGGFNVRHR